MTNLLYLCEMEKKYYTPEVSDLFVGYQCEASFSSFAGIRIWDLNNPTKDELHEPKTKKLQGIGASSS